MKWVSIQYNPALRWVGGLAHLVAVARAPLLFAFSCRRAGFPRFSQQHNAIAAFIPISAHPDPDQRFRPSPVE
jgi:hypothetical protein